MSRLKSAVLLAFLLLPLMANAQTKPPAEGAQLRDRMKQNIQQMDADKDGAISKTEFMADAEKRFARMDADKDGKISKEEMAKRADRTRQDSQYP